MRSDADTVEAYLDRLPGDRRDALASVRKTILEHLPDGYEEAMNWGMICYQVPLERSGPTYNGQPLMYAALAAQKRHLAVYLTSVYADPSALEDFREQYAATGKTLDMGKSCVRFKRLEDLPLDLLGRTIAAVDVDRFLGSVRASRQP